MSHFDVELAKFKARSSLRWLCYSMIALAIGGLGGWVGREGDASGSILGMLASILGWISTFFAIIVFVITSTLTAMWFVAACTHLGDYWIWRHQREFGLAHSALVQFGLRHLLGFMSVASVALTIIRLVRTYVPEIVGHDLGWNVLAAFTYAYCIGLGAYIIRDTQ